jgi:hypothetical protein
VTTSVSWQDAFDVIKRGHEYGEVPFRLASGQTSQHYIDGKHAVDTGERQIEFDAVGGLSVARVRRTGGAVSSARDLPTPRH